MLKEQAKLFRNINLLIDVALISLALILAYHVRAYAGTPLLALDQYVWILLVIVPVWLTLMHGRGLYSSIRKMSIFDILSRLVNVHLFGGVLGASLIYFFDRDQYSRSLYLTFLLLSFLLLSVERIFVRVGLGYFRRRGLNIRNLLIVGTFEKAGKFLAMVEEHADWGLNVVGFLQVVDGPLKDEVLGHKVLGRIGDLGEICKHQPVDEVIFCLPKDFVLDTEEALICLEELGITGRVVLDYYDVPQFRKEVSFFHEDLPILTFHSKAFDAQQLLLKRVMDIFGALIGLALLALVFPFVAVAIKLNSAGPIFFGQERIGENGRLFTCWKFRSMYADAEARKSDLMQRNEMNGAIFKIRNDPRVTSVGRFIRKTSIDELPQFWNVLKGEMSLVGTRPPTLDEFNGYENWHHRRISIKPGITGNWQISGRSGITDFDTIVRLDLAYIDSWNIWLDLKIILKTIFVVFTRAGSY